METLTKLHEQASANAREDRSRQAKSYNARHHDIQFAVGDKVLEKERNYIFGS